MPDEQNGNGFYKEQAWGMVLNEISDLKKMSQSQAKDLADIKAKINYIYGFAAAIGVFTTVIIEWVRSKFFK